MQESSLCLDVSLWGKSFDIFHDGELAGEPMSSARPYFKWSFGGGDSSLTSPIHRENGRSDRSVFASWAIVDATLGRA